MIRLVMSGSEECDALGDEEEEESRMRRKVGDNNLFNLLMEIVMI